MVLSLYITFVVVTIFFYHLKAGQAFNPLKNNQTDPIRPQISLLKVQVQGIDVWKISFFVDFFSFEYSPEIELVEILILRLEI